MAAPPAPAVPAGRKPRRLLRLQQAWAASSVAVFLAANAPDLDETLRFLRAADTTVVVEALCLVGAVVSFWLAVNGWRRFFGPAIEEERVRRLPEPAHLSFEPAASENTPPRSIPAPSPPRMCSLLFDADDIAYEEDPRAQRGMLRRFGEERFLADVHAQQVATDRYGSLHRIDRVWIPPLCMVLVKCPSTKRPYLLRVPMTIASAHEGVAWSFGLAQEQYAPLVES